MYMVLQIGYFNMGRSTNAIMKCLLVPCILFILIVNAAHAFNELEDVHFELYTREFPDSWQILNASRGDDLLQTSWKAERPTRFFVHGYRSKRKMIERYSKAFLQAGDYNFIAVNWMEGSTTRNYYAARNRVKKVRYIIFSLRFNLFFKKKNVASV